MQSVTSLEVERTIGQGGRVVVENYVQRVSRLYAGGKILSPGHAAFLERVATVLPTLSDKECTELARALTQPRLSVLAQAIAEAYPGLLE
jgi:hypothetical protein